MSLAQRIQHLLDRCMRDEIGPDSTSEWEALRSDPGTAAASLGRPDVERLHLAGYRIFDRLGKPAVALEQLGQACHFRRTRRQENCSIGPVGC